MQTMEIPILGNADVMAVTAKVPGSVQHALRQAGRLPDWNVGLNARQCEWVENRHWIYEGALPDEWMESGKTHRLKCLGLDYSGSVLLNGQTVGTFCGTHIPHVFDLTPHLTERGNVLRIVFDLPPRWLGQFGFTSQVREWKARFNYTWDWMPRLVQIGIWDNIFLEVTDGLEIDTFCCVADANPADGTGSLKATGHVAERNGGVVRVSLTRDDAAIREEEMETSQFNTVGVSWEGLPVALWYPNREGEQPLYTVTCALVDGDGNE